MQLSTSSNSRRKNKNRPPTFRGLCSAFSKLGKSSMARNTSPIDSSLGGKAPVHVEDNQHSK